MSIQSRSHQYGTVFENWQILELLGQGSGGKTAVFRLKRIDSNRGQSALKVINLIEERGDWDTMPAPLRKEYEAARDECKNSALQEVWLMDDFQGNTNIVDYLDHKFVEWTDETGFGCDMLIRMELLKDLRSELRTGKIFSEADIIKIGCDICLALVLCHGNGILHRDIKPENIFVNRNGSYKLGDFGISRIVSNAPMSMASTGIGTPEYAAPEQTSGKYDKRVDIYSLGLVLYELSNQFHLPFAKSSYVRPDDVNMRISGVPLLPPATASKDFSKVILKACAYKADDRYQTAQDFLAALSSLGQGLAPHSTAPVSAKASADATPYAQSPYSTEPAIDTSAIAQHGSHRVINDRSRTGYDTAPAIANTRSDVVETSAYGTVPAIASSTVVPKSVQRYTIVPANPVTVEQHKKPQNNKKANSKVPGNKPGTVVASIATVGKQDNALLEKAEQFRNKVLTGSVVIDNAKSIHARVDGAGTVMIEKPEGFAHKVLIGESIKLRITGISTSGRILIGELHQDSSVDKDKVNGSAIEHTESSNILEKMRQGLRSIFSGESNAHSNNSLSDLMRYAKKDESGESQFLVGKAHAEGKLCEQNHVLSFEWFSKSAEYKYGPGITATGNCFFYGLGVKKDQAKAVDYYLKAYDCHDGEAAFRLGCLREESPSKQLDLLSLYSAVQLFESSAIWGYTPACFKLGKCYELGCGVKYDLRRAFEWYKRGAENNDIPAIMRVASFYETGKYVSKDLEKWKEWIKCAANLGDAAAQFKLAECYEHEGSIYIADLLDKPDTEIELALGEAIRLYKLSADQEYGMAVSSLDRLQKSLQSEAEKGTSSRFSSMALRLLKQF